MKQYRFVLCALAFGLILFSCKKDNPSEQETEKEHEEYFEGSVNGEPFQPDGHWGCASVYGTYYPDGFLDFEGGFLTFTVRNCSSSERIYLGKQANLHEGVFTSVDTSDNERPWCTFADLDYEFQSSDGESVYLRASHRLEIRLEITNVDHIEEYDSYYIEGLLDAVVRDTVIDSTIVISNVKFGHLF